MIGKMRIRRAVKALSKGECLIIATTDTKDGQIECTSLLTRDNDKVGAALHATLVNSNEIRAFILNVVGKYLSRYEVEQKAFIESLK